MTFKQWFSSNAFNYPSQRKLSLVSISSIPLSKHYTLFHSFKMFALNLGQRLIALHHAQASFRPYVHRLVPWTTVKPAHFAMMAQRPNTTSTYLPTRASNLRIRSYSKQAWEIPKGYGKRKPAISNASAFAESSNENTNKKCIDEANLATHVLKPGGLALNHLLQTRKDDSVVWGEDFIGYQIEHHRPSFVFEDVEEEEQTAKDKIRGTGTGNQTVLFKAFYDAWLAGDDNQAKSAEENASSKTQPDFLVRHRSTCPYLFKPLIVSFVSEICPINRIYPPPFSMLQIDNPSCKYRKHYDSASPPRCAAS